MIPSPPRRYMRSDATKLSSADYEDIMQYRDMKSKPLDQLRKKFHISTSRSYQIWKGQEVGRVEWNYSAVPISYSRTNDIDKQNGTDLGGHEVAVNKYDFAFTALENKICNAEINKSTDPVSKGGAGRDQPKSVNISELTITQNQLIPGTKKEIISSTESSEDVLDLYKRTSPEIEHLVVLLNN
ncbi:10299_t:CDS:2 [Ambispora gerdemannii]|uniref:10299_t:CDS:1 n=1 Tax=Ambispora gerdemannii TaxID=144530 RepID=A0A9N8VCS5_9GLOM|nr:10299_t:CDS:2 [Ambispora gerdemannii]